MSTQLTASSVAKYRAGTGRIEIADAACPGLYLVIQPSGHKGWALRFRRPNGQSAKLTLGTVYAVAKKDGEPGVEPVIGGHLTLAAAHRLVTKLKHEIAQGRDPAAAHQKAKLEARLAGAEAAANTFASAARGFVEQHCRPKVRRWHELSRLLGLKPDTLAVIPKGLADRWSKRAITEIDGHDIHTVVDEARRFGVPGLEVRGEGPSDARARKFFAVLSKLFSWLMQRRRVTVNPCAGVHRPEPPKARDRVLSPAEIEAFWKAAEAANRPFDGLLKLLLLTGCRLSEVARMRWSELDGATWVIPGERTKNHRAHVVPLPPQAVEIIAAVSRIEDSDFVFTTTGCSPISGWSKTKDRLDEAMKLSAPWVLHDLRRTCATGMAEIGIAPHIVEAVLNHVSGARAGVAGVYNRAAYLPEKTAALQRWAVHVDGLVEGRKAKVTPLRRA